MERRLLLTLLCLRLVVIKTVEFLLTLDDSEFVLVKTLIFLSNTEIHLGGFPLISGAGEIDGSCRV